MLFRIAPAVLISAALLGCADRLTTPATTDTDAEYTGTLAAFLEAPISPGHGTRVLVEQSAPSSSRDKAIVHLGAESRILVVEPGGRVREGSVRDLSVGNRVQVWTTGVELRSYPVQVFAVKLQVGP